MICTSYVVGLWSELRVGDVLVGDSTRDHVRLYDDDKQFEGWYQVERTDHPNCKIYLTRVKKLTPDVNSLNTLNIVYKSFSVMQPLIAVGHPIVDDFPGKCTRCGRKAYVGLREVLHQNETAARDCPAPRAV